MGPKRRRLLPFLMLVLFGAGCLQQAKSQSKPRAKFTAQVAHIQLGNKKLLVELAETFDERQLGLMFRPTPTGNRGMLFVAGNAHTQSFWMKNTPGKLDIGFFDTADKLCDVHALEPFNTTSVYSSKKGRLALEMARGWYKKNGIRIGTKLKIIQIRPRTTGDEPKLVPLGP